MFLKTQKFVVGTEHNNSHSRFDGEKGTKHRHDHSTMTTAGTQPHARPLLHELTLSIDFVRPTVVLGTQCYGRSADDAMEASPPDDRIPHKAVGAPGPGLAPLHT